jgi:hypothetical protein
MPETISQERGEVKGDTLALSRPAEQTELGCPEADEVRRVKAEIAEYWRKYGCPNREAHAPVGPASPLLYAEGWRLSYLF